MEVGIVVGVLALPLVFYVRIRSKKSSRDAASKKSSRRTTQGDFKDAWEGHIRVSEVARHLKAQIKFDYVDGKGQDSESQLQVEEFDNELNGGTVYGHCELRQAKRNFRLDRISNCVDLSTGEVIADIKQFLNVSYESSAEYSVEKLVDEFQDVLKTLNYVASCDGRFTKNEKAVIAEYVAGLLGDDRITPELVTPAIKSVGAVHLQGFKLALGKALKDERVDAEELSHCCREVIGTKKKGPSAVEQEALDYLDRKYSAA